MLEIRPNGLLPGMLMFGRRAERPVNPIKRLYPEGVDRIEIVQSNQLSDCQLLGPLYALSRNRRAAQVLARLIRIKPNGDYVVRFAKYPDRPQVVRPEEVRQQRPPKGSRKRPHADSALGIRIIERAYAKLMLDLYPRRYKDVPKDNVLMVYESKSYHYLADRVVEDLTGWRMAWIPRHHTRRMRNLFLDFARNPDDYVILVATADTPTYKSDLVKLKEAFAKVASPDELAKLEAVIKKIFKPADLEDGQYSVDLGNKIPPHHLVSVESADPVKETLTLRDPHNTRIGLEVRYQDFFKQIRGIMVAKVPRTL